MSSSAAFSVPGLLCFPVLGRNDKLRQLPCIVLERDGRWLRLEMNQPVSWAAIVGVEYGDLYWAGEVVVCAAQSEEVWLVQLEIQELITQLQSLLQLHNQLGIPASWPEDPTPPKGTVRDSLPERSLTSINA